jgi:hypothetical protein
MKKVKVAKADQSIDVTVDSGKKGPSVGFNDTRGDDGEPT